MKEYKIISASQTNQKGPVKDLYSFIRNRYSFLFGNSYMYLPIKSKLFDEENGIAFGYSPIPFIIYDIPKNSFDLKDFRLRKKI